MNEKNQARIQYAIGTQCEWTVPVDPRDGPEAIRSKLDEARARFRNMEDVFRVVYVKPGFPQ